MKIIVTHKSADMDGITSIWLLKKFLGGWENAKVRFVYAGDKLDGKYEKEGDVIEIVDGNEVIHVDTGLGKLDHHQVMDQNICAASLTYDYVLKQETLAKTGDTKKEAIKRIVDVVTDDDHFQDVFKQDTLSYHESFSLFSILDGMKLEYPAQDEKYVDFGMQCLDMLLHVFENRVWAENEIKEKGIEFQTKWGKGIALETLNDFVLELIQKMGYVVAIRKDPNNGFVRIKARPEERSKIKDQKLKIAEVDLTPVYEKLKKMDPHATWYLHVSKKMLLNGSSKNPVSLPSKLRVEEIIKVLEEIE